MRDGLLQQAGSPQELYDFPVNVFVAGFIGSPSMNFASAKIDGDNLQVGSATLALSDRPAQVAKERKDGSEVMIGFRPEHLELANGTGSGVALLPAKVDVVEYLGNEELLHAQVEGNDIVALVPSDRRVKVGESVDFTIPMDKLHVFDPETERSLTV
jgi:multiple sugar transport system ATP-binding protein